MLLLDTHVLLWFVQGDKALGHRSRRYLDRFALRQELFVSAISFYEIGLHVANGKVKLDEPVEGWRQTVLDDGIGEVGVDGMIAVRASELSGMPGDPIDRLIAATAVCRGVGLMTADSAILAWRGKLRRLDASE
jgi:PIN domain nuclease of toxin-antitoxin system